MVCVCVRVCVITYVCIYSTVQYNVSEDSVLFPGSVRGVWLSNHRPSLPGRQARQPHHPGRTLHFRHLRGTSARRICSGPLRAVCELLGNTPFHKTLLFELVLVLYSFSVLVCANKLL